MSEGFLVLMRRPGEAIMIGDDITIVFQGLKHGQARFAIKAPRQVSVHRREVYLRIQAEKEQQLTPEYPGIYDASDPL